MQLFTGTQGPRKRIRTHGSTGRARTHAAPVVSHSLDHKDKHNTKATRRAGHRARTVSHTRRTRAAYSQPPPIRTMVRRRRAVPRAAPAPLAAERQRSTARECGLCVAPRGGWPPPRHTRVRQHGWRARASRGAELRRARRRQTTSTEGAPAGAPPLLRTERRAPALPLRDPHDCPHPSGARRAAAATAPPLLLRPSPAYALCTTTSV